MVPTPTMSAEEFGAALARLGVDGEGRWSSAARMLGCTPRAVRYWRTGQRRVPGPVVILLGVLQAMS